MAHRADGVPERRSGFPRRGQRVARRTGAHQEGLPGEARVAVREHLVVARADDQDLVKPAAFVVLKDGAEVDTDALKEHIKGKIGMWKYPRWVSIVEELPKTATGKVQKFLLRALAKEG